VQRDQLGIFERCESATEISGRLAYGSGVRQLLFNYPPEKTDTEVNFIMGRGPRTGQGAQMIDDLFDNFGLLRQRRHVLARPDRRM